MDVEEVRSILKFSAKERSALGYFGLPDDAFLPMLLSLKAGGSWSYSSDVLTSMAVKKTTTYYDENEKCGSTLEEIYLFVDPDILDREGTVHRLEKCSRKGERVLVKRPYRVTVTAGRIILARVDPKHKLIELRELEEKRISFTGSPAYSAVHEMEHLTEGEVEGAPLWDFDIRIAGE